MRAIEICQFHRHRKSYKLIYSPCAVSMGSQHGDRSTGFNGVIHLMPL